MKKLAYIILVVAILLLIGNFVKTEQNITHEPEAQAAVEKDMADITNGVSAAVSQAENAAAQPEQTVPAEDSDVVNVQETTEDIIIEEGAPEDDGAVDVEETSEATMDEEETVLPE